MATTRTDARRMPASEREAQIIDVATRLFRDGGYHATSLGDIADALGFSKPAIYHYFDAKEDILFSIVDGIVDRALARFEQILARGDGPTATMHELLLANTCVLLEHQDANTVFYDNRGLLSPEREAAIRELEREFTGIVRSTYVAGVEAGEFVDLDPAVATATLLGASISAYRWFDPDGPLSIEEVAEQIATIQLDGYRR